MSLDEQVREYIKKNGEKPFAAIKYGTDAKRHSNSVLKDILKQLISMGEVEETRPEWYKLANGHATTLVVQKAVQKPEPVPIVQEEVVPEPVVVQEKVKEQKLETIVQPKPIEVVQRYVIAPNGIKILPDDVNNYFIEEEVPYISRDGEIKKLDSHLKRSKPLLIEGHKGIAKTQRIRHYCWKNKIPIVVIDCHAQIDSGDLVGHFVMHENETVYVLGAIAKAIKFANEFGKCCLCFEEFNAMSQEMQKGTNSLLDRRKNVVCHDTSETYSLQKGKQLLIVGTMNVGAGYGGTFTLNEECNSRWPREHNDYPDAEYETRILKAMTTLSDDYIEHLVALASETRNSPKVAFKLSTRELCDFGELLEMYKESYKSEKEAINEAFRTAIVDRYVGEDDKQSMQLVVDAIKRIFDIQVKV